MKALYVSMVVGYVMSGLMGAVGVLVLSGILVLQGMPVTLRILFGSVLVMYSVYRFLMTRSRAKQAESTDE